MFHPGGMVSSTRWAGCNQALKSSRKGGLKIVKEDEAWGIDCLDPHNNVTREEVQIMLRLELSADMRSVTLTLLQQGTGGWLPWAQLRQRDGAAPTVVL